MDRSSQNLPSELRIAFIKARWHAEIVNQAAGSFAAEISKAANVAAQIDSFDVPGAFEIPLQARMLGRSGRYDAIAACAFIVDGGIYQHQFVAQTVLDALMQAQMDADIPMISIVLTPHHFHDSEKHQSFFLEHFKLKGEEAAEACLQVLSVRKEMSAVA